MLLPNGRGDPQLAIISGLEKKGEAVDAEPLLAEIEHIKFYLYTRYKKYILNLILYINNIIYNIFHILLYITYYHKGYTFNILNTSKNTKFFFIKY